MNNNYWCVSVIDTVNTETCARIYIFVKLFTGFRGGDNFFMKVDTSLHRTQVPCTM